MLALYMLHSLFSSFLRNSGRDEKKFVTLTKLLPLSEDEPAE